jgi:hypothetical protein
MLSKIILLIFTAAVPSFNQEIGLSGSTIDKDGNPVTGVAVSLETAGLIDTTGADGRFQLGQAQVAVAMDLIADAGPSIRDGALHFSVREDRQLVYVGIYDVRGRNLAVPVNTVMSAGKHTVPLMDQLQGNSLLLLRMVIGPEEMTYKLALTANSCSFSFLETGRTTTVLNKRAAPFVDRLYVYKEGYYPRMLNIENYIGELPPIALMEYSQAFQDKIDSISEQVQQSRELQFKQPIHAAIMVREQYGDRFYSSDGGGQEDDRSLTTLLQQITFLRKSDSITSINEARNEFGGGFAFAFYLNGTDSIFLVAEDENTELDSMFSLSYFDRLMAHELLHTQQHQQFNLFGTDQFYNGFTTDYYNAKRCLTEGDARFTEYTYENIYVNESSTPFQEAVQFSLDLKNGFFPKLLNPDELRPEYLKVPGYAPYELGPYYIASHYESGGWDAVNDIYANRPLSMAEVTTGSRFLPVSFDFSGFSQYMEEGSYQVEDTFGSLMWSIILKWFDQQPDVLAVMENAWDWSGDRMLYSHDRGEGYGKFIWAVALQHDQAAQRVYEALYVMNESGNDDIYRPVFHTVSLDSTQEYVCAHFTSDTMSTALCRTGDQVWWIENMGNATADIISSMGTVTAASAAKLSAQSGRLYAARNPLHRFLERRLRWYRIQQERIK